ncbi:MAG TPA: site-specific integrase, partial [Gemmatimonadales bacterium]|nr:site-specific integrase [Gemmatimonadales bacterium]
MSLPELRERIERDFVIEGFRDYLGLEAGHSPNTVEAYARDVRRLGEFALSKGVKAPAGFSRTLLRDHIFLLKDLGLSPSSIRRAISAIRTYFG